MPTDPNPAAEHYRHFAQLSAAGDWAGALAALGRALEADPALAADRGSLEAASPPPGQAAPAWPVLAAALAARGKPRAALIAWHRALAADPADPQACRALGALYLSGNLQPQAQAALARARELAPDEATTQAAPARLSAGEASSDTAPVPNLPQPDPPPAHQASREAVPPQNTAFLFGRGCGGNLFLLASKEKGFPHILPSSSSSSSLSLPLDRGVEEALLAAGLWGVGRQAEAQHYAGRALASLQERGEAAAPPEVLAAWGVGGLTGLVVRLCVGLASHSTFYQLEQARGLLGLWRRAEPGHPQAAWLMGLGLALAARREGRTAPREALACLNQGEAYAGPARGAAALALARGEAPAALALPYDGGEVWAPGDLAQLSTYVLLEQGDWFEPELTLFRALARPGARVLDLGANLGLYALAAARRVGPGGRVLAVEPGREAFGLLTRSAAPWPGLTCRQVAVGGSAGRAVLTGAERLEMAKVAATGPGEEVAVVTLAGLLAAEGWEGVDLLKMDVEGLESQVLAGSTAWWRAHDPVVIYEVKEGPHWRRGLIAQFRELGYDSFLYQAPAGRLVPVGPEDELPPLCLNLVAVKPAALERLARLAGQGPVE
ncbi:MAG: FkbM family methyltransferase [Deltaproteobacteria bacterium]|nr:FkbM family methyltransferase [Deltaproteobacteria bacterium]